MLSIILALVAAFLFAVGTVFQQKGAMEESEEAAQSAGFLLTLARKPVWLFGVVMSGLGFAAQAAALGVGRLVVVQPLLVTSIVFALPFGARYTGQRVGKREIIGAVAVTAGIAAFLVISDPSEGRDDAPVVEWLIAGGILGAMTIVLVLASRGRRPGLKAAFLGTAAGILFGLISALTKSTVDRLEDGIVHVVADWHLWVLIAVSVAAFTILQSALQAGALAPALACLMAFETVAGGAIGVVLFEEQLNSSAGAIVGEVAVLLVALAGLILLAQSESAAEHARAPAPEPEAASP
jgi:drug/metabolite transporter (DMT)-like permease